MRKIREVLRLDSLGLSQRQIALSCCVGQATVSGYLKTAAQAGLQWRDIAEWGEERLLDALAPAGPAAGRRKRVRLPGILRARLPCLGTHCARPEGALVFPRLDHRWPLWRVVGFGVPFRSVPPAVAGLK